MSARTIEMTDKLYHYLLSVLPQEPMVMRELRQATLKLPLAMMQISPEQAQFMQLLIQLIGAKKILEIGTFTGYSALALALALPAAGQVIACDTSKEWTDIAKSYWIKAGVEHKIKLHLAPALETLDQFISENKQNSFDFAFIDADKPSYLNYYEQTLQLVRPGGLIAIDNVFMAGGVLEAVKSKGIRTICALNEKIKRDDRVNFCIVPIGDGLTLARKL